MSECTFVPVEDQYVFLSDLWVHPTKRNQGEATKLLYHIADFTLKRGLNLIRLDDMSKHYRSANNIYLTLGFEYEDGTEGCEMAARASYVMINIKKRL